MAEAIAHFLEHIFGNIREKGEQPLLCEKRGEVFHTFTLREAAARISDIARALHNVSLSPGDRVLFCAAPEAMLLISEWAVLAGRGVPVITPRSFSPEDLIDVLKESKSKLAVVDRLTTALHLADNSAAVPDLKVIVCMEGSSVATLPVWSWEDFIDSARKEADRSSSSLRAIAGKDTALMFYSLDHKGIKQASRYTHAQLLDYIAQMGSMLADHAVQKGELVMTATSWEQPIGHIAACYLPVAKEAVVEITHAMPSPTLFESSPQAVVGDAAFFDGVRESIESLIRNGGKIDAWLLTQAMLISRQSFESRKTPLLKRLGKNFLKATIVKKGKKLLGGRLRLLIGTDDDAHYETQLFFHTFGVELVELPEEAFR